MEVRKPFSINADVLARSLAAADGHNPEKYLDLQKSVRARYIALAHAAVADIGRQLNLSVIHVDEEPKKIFPGPWRISPNGE